ncbi:hypothetical protein PRIPAC_82381 [Pristionchus pacificus]|uniref:Serpentine receptor class r-10 n=1 Tax=Pristionchus pacificus TaxID=54126 RepID=A0A2A6CNM1_PRIPA|nr:hypothetical protein PRIPAC_82381 [Pristionchus pacificus]|eukprot:PDM79729.1 G protein-coupled receptor [Pristionchus pacificus]
MNMANPLYAWTFTKPFHEMFLGTTTTVSLFSNSLLLLIIYSTSSQHIGSYRYLLAFFAICDITTTIAHAALQPFVHMTSVGFYFFSSHPQAVILGVPFGTISCILFIATYYQTFLVLAYHFIYRYLTVTSGLGASFTAFWTTAHWMAVGAIVNVVYIAVFVVAVAIGMRPTEERRRMIPAEIMEIYNLNLSDPRSGFTIVELRKVDPVSSNEEWIVKSVVSFGSCVLLFAATAAVIVFCIYKTNAAINSAHNLLTPRTRRMHHQLFRALLIQTAVPCLFSYAPLSLILLTGGVTGISLGAFGNVLFLTTAIFPSIDAFFVLFFIVRFRIAVIRLFRLPFSTSGMGSSVEHRVTLRIDKHSSFPLRSTLHYYSSRFVLLRLRVMDPSVYSWIFKDPFHAIFVGTTTSVSFFSNSLLIFIIYTTSAEHLGAYRYLLTFFALCDISTTIGHATLQPYVHMTSTGFYFFLRNPGIIVFGFPVDNVFCLTFIATYYQTFLILAYHFVYRYKTVTSGIGDSCTDTWRKAHWITVGIVVYIIYIAGFVVVVGVGMTPSDETRGLVPPEIFDLYGINLKDNRTGFTVLAMRRPDSLTKEIHWSAESTISIFICLCLFSGTAGVIIFCIYQTTVAIKSAASVLTPFMKQMHGQLFRALLIQTAVPCLFSYAPLSLILMFGGLTGRLMRATQLNVYIPGISFGAFGNVLFLTTAIFPSVDAFFVLYFIVKFRIAVIRLFHLPFKVTGMGTNSVEPMGNLSQSGISSHASIS